ncbi:MAG TPA: 23S rRNA (adenine(2503)-C(2))-methyltransferase RlmN [Patescibacteria group bacterium]|nr:23S rRNA (adenine(2503)-C(2))-methyltransferase RlmN [Patescibacteria group bacterium]
MEQKKNIKDFSLEELESYIVQNKLPKFRAGQIFDWIYKDVESFEQMTNLSKELISKLKQEFYIGRAAIEVKLVSKEDKTRKYLLKLEDGNAVECVLMEYSYGKTICISTQVGCRMNCAFCASAIGGLTRHMTSGEMLEEVMAVSRDIGERISNIVLMGTGEPFDNYKEVIKFLRTVNNQKGMNVGQRHITISTSGLVPKILEFAEEELQCTLAISLHAADNPTRNTLMPINKKYKIEELMDACRQYIKKTNRRITFEYALIKDINDNEESAYKLSNLLRGMLCHVNLIPINKVEEKVFEKANKTAIDKFKSILESNGIEATVRRELGSDINAACGQLRQQYGM